MDGRFGQFTRKTKRPSLLINIQCAKHNPVQRVSACALSESPREEFATEILPWLYLGTAKDASNHSMLNQKNIKFILNTTREEDANNSETGVRYMKLGVDDHSDAPIAKHFSSCYDFIEEARMNQCSVLVHCRRGISRSATIVISYIMKFLGKSFEDAFDFVKQKRDIINPNLGFVLALESMNVERPGTAPTSTLPSPRTASPPREPYRVACGREMYDGVMAH
eukprot:NODE_3254_length_1251_cov_138.421986_g3090_i0.p1 GENE.NODE_3254_length_1251_cov_138.421986_g3090_i0~~NODE_3254_length_1251_cov_138.421986_g3090_i0.p1  ORF type:complete len:223 (-),score=24.25 NODE_3254_length_1251_cov_138.421986_g3090_i0:503-1171(-)